MPRKVESIKDETSFLQTLSDKLRHTARNPDISRYVPHAKQVEFHSSCSPGRQVIGGNRSGKTVGGATETIWYATGNHPYKKLPWKPPLRLRVCTVDLVQGLEKIVLPEIAKWCPNSSLINGSWEDSYNKHLRTLTFENKSFIEFLTYEQELQKFAGTSRHGVWFDEEPPKDIFVECKLRLVDTEGHWWMTMTPVDGISWSFEEIYEKNDPYIHIIEVDMDDNPHLTDQGKSIVLSGLSENEIIARKKGQYVSLGGKIYTEFKEDEHVIDSHPIPETALQVASMDHGYTNPTCWLWAYIDEMGRIVIYDEWYKAREIVEHHAWNVHRINSIHGNPPVYNVGDPSIRNVDPITGTSVQIEYMDHGIPISLGNNDVRAGIDRVKKLIANNQLYITRNCINLIWELRRYRWSTWKNSRDQYQKNKKEEPQKKDDHACDALRYLVASRPMVEDGRTIPRATNTINAPVAIEPGMPLIDREVNSIKKEQPDFHLGSDY